MPAFQTVFKPSRMLQTTIMVLHVSAVGVCLYGFYGVMMWLGLLGLGVSWFYAQHHAGLKGQKVITQIAIDRAQRAVVWMGQKEKTAFAAVLEPSSLVSHYVLFLHWDMGEGRKVWQLVLPDMLERDAHRRLRVWARWCQDSGLSEQTNGVWEQEAIGRTSRQ